MKYQPHVTFSAQGVVVHSLMRMLDRVKAEDLDPFDYLPVLVYMAFAVEAYVNSVGFRKVPCWEDIERRSWKSKIETLHSHVGASPDWAADPLKVAPEIFSIRDRIAHGKPESVAGPVCDDYHTAISMLYVQHIKPTMFTGLDRDLVLTLGRRFYALLNYLGSLYGLESDEFSSFSTSNVQQLADS